jgi:hypothetical protein
MNLIQFLKGERKIEDAWLEVAQRVLAGGYNDADTSTIKSIQIGLRSLNHPDCRAALKRIEELL